MPWEEEIIGLWWMSLLWCLHDGGGVTYRSSYIWCRFADIYANTGSNYPPRHKHSATARQWLLEVWRCFFCGCPFTGGYRMPKDEKGTFICKLYHLWVEFTEMTQIFYYRVWVVVSIIFTFAPNWGDDPIWLMFFRWVGSTTNQTFKITVFSIIILTPLGPGRWAWVCCGPEAWLPYHTGTVSGKWDATGEL